MSLGIQQGVNKVLSLAGMLGSIRAKNAPETEKPDQRAVPMDKTKRGTNDKSATKKLPSHVAETKSQESLKDAQTQKRKRINFNDYVLPNGNFKRIGGGESGKK